MSPAHATRVSCLIANVNPCRLCSLGGAKGNLSRVGCVLSGACERNLFDHRKPVALESHDLPGVIREQADSTNAELAEDLRTNPVKAQILSQRSLGCRSVRFCTLPTGRVKFQIFREAGSVPLLAKIDKYPPIGRLDHAERSVQMDVLLPSLAVKDIQQSSLLLHAH